MEYDDDRELTRYIWDHYGKLMTEFEQKVGWAHLAELKTISGYPAVGEFILRRHGIVDDVEAQAALADGVEAFRRRVRDRLLTEHTAAIFIKRCLRCSSVVRTPNASQCFWCGFDWHGQASP